ncbi:MAG: hypothetical protein GY754_13740 [bacterium]|nr:hypothetical protein [bacterium]
MENNKSSIIEVFSPDLQYIINSSIKFRWVAGGGVLILPFILSFFDYFVAPLPVIITAIVILLYNIVFFYLEAGNKKKTDVKEKFKTYVRMGWMQIILDYCTLMVTLYFVGGLHTILFYLLLFHIIIGSVILSTRYMYVMSIFSISGFYIVSLLELKRIIPNYNLFHLSNDLSHKLVVTESAIHFVILLGAVFMISLLTGRIKTDTVKLIEVNDNLKENIEYLKALEKRKSKFMRFSAHQLRSPLATIIAALNVLTRKMVPLDSGRAESLLDGANEKAKSLLELVIDLLDLSGLREGRRKVKFENNFNLVNLIEEIIHSLIEQVTNKELKIYRNYTLDSMRHEYSGYFRYEEEFKNHLNDLPAGTISQGDKELLKHCFYNLIQNAVKYSKPGGNIYIDFLDRVEDDEHDGTENSLLMIKDEGIGIDKEFLGDIFVEFVRSPNAKEVENDGTGLGLSIAREILERHKGAIGVASELDVGTTFTITFPVLIA